MFAILLSGKSEHVSIIHRARELPRCGVFPSMVSGQSSEQGCCTQVFICLVTTATLVFPFPNFQHVQFEAQTFSILHLSKRTLSSSTWNTGLESY
jgi:hypothetical protein